MHMSSIKYNTILFMIFQGSADLSGMDGTRDLVVSKVVHKAFIDVNEEGTEAAAATGMTIALSAAMPQEPNKFYVDRPSMFFIYNKTTRHVLFLGRLAHLESEDQQRKEEL